MDGQSVDEFAQARGELRGASADDVPQTQQDGDGKENRDDGADAAGDKLRLVGFKPVADFRGIGYPQQTSYIRCLPGISEKTPCWSVGSDHSLKRQVPSSP